MGETEARVRKDSQPRRELCAHAGNVDAKEITAPASVLRRVIHSTVILIFKSLAK